MKPKKRCVHCGRSFFLKRNPQQIYCSQESCQIIRRNTWRKNKLQQDNDYRCNQINACRHWRKRHPDYWRQYRANHPAYTLHNQRRTADRKRANSQLNRQSTEFANSDALTSVISIQSGTYALIPQVANSDALLVEIKLLSRSY